MRSLIIILIALICSLVVTPKYALTDEDPFEIADYHFAPVFNYGLLGVFGGYIGGSGDWDNDGDGVMDWSIGNTVPFSLTRTDDMVFSTNIGSVGNPADWKERMRITNDGNVGIGMTNPNVSLAVAKDQVTSIIRSTTYMETGGFPGVFSGCAARGTQTSPNPLQAGDPIAAFAGVGFGTSGFVGPPPQAVMAFVAQENFTNTAKGTGIFFRTTPIGSTTLTSRMNITANGNVGIGTTSPTDILHVKSPAGVDTGLVLDTTDSTGGANSSFIDFYRAGVLNFGIGPNVDDTISFYGSDSVLKFTLNQNGWLGLGSNVLPTQPLIVSSGAHVTAGGVWTNASSRDYKENIFDLTIEDAKMALNDLRPKRYNYKVDNEDECLGFIAEDVPELVASKDRKSLSPMDIVAVLTKVVQEQQDEIDHLKAKNNQLSETLTTLTNRQDAIEDMLLALTTSPKEKLVKHNQAGLDGVQKTIQ